MKRTALLILGLLLAVEAPVEAKDKNFYTAGEFEDIIENAGSRTKNNGTKTASGPVPIFAGFEGAGTGQWRVNVSGAFGIGDNRVRTLTYPALIRNLGSKMEVLFLGQPIPEVLADGVLHHKGTQKAVRAWQKKFRDVPVEVGLEDNRIYLKAEYSYTDGVSEGDINGRLRYLWEACSGVIVWSYHAQDDVKDEIMKRLEGKVTYLTESEFKLLTEDDDWDDYETEVDGVSEGAWDFSYQDRSMDLLNYGDRIVVQHTRKIPAAASDQVRAGMIEGMQKWVSKNKVKHATTEVRWSEEDRYELVIASTFTLDGKLKGSDMIKSYQEFLDKWSAKAGDEVDSILEGLREALVKSKPERLSRADFLMLMQDDVTDFEKEHDEATEGFWSFSFHERGFEMYNYGDRIVLSYWKELPEASEARRTRFLAQIQQWIGKKRAKNADTMEASWHEDGDEYIHVRATYELGDLKGKDLHEAYWHFKREYSEALEEEVEDAIASL